MANPLTNAADGGEKIASAFKEATTAMVQFDTAMKNMYTRSGDLTSNLNTLLTSAGTLSNALGNGLGGALTTLGLSIPQFGTDISNMIGKLQNVGEHVLKMAENFDSLGAQYRGMLIENYKIATSFGAGAEGAAELTQRMLDLEKVNSTMSRSGFYISGDETTQAFKNMNIYAGNISNEFLKFNGIIGDTSVKAEQVTAILSKSSGLEGLNGGDSAYYYELNKLIAQQGMSFEQAIGSIADYKSISKETGLTVSTISDALGGAVSSFSRLGLTVDFAKPALQGFADVMKSVGLGISEASSLTQTLSTSLMNVANDYGKAYVLFQQGGLDFGGGGGVLGSSIGFRASMMNATPEEQEKMGASMIDAMKESLSTLTGGRGIVTVSQASSSPELQSLYLGQEKILESMYGIGNQADRDRTLELLQQIETANSEGDRDRAAQLTEEFQDAQKQREATTSTTEKLGLIAQSSYGEHIKQTYLLQKQLEATLMSERFGQALGLDGNIGIGDAVAQLSDAVSGNLVKLDKALVEAIGNPEKSREIASQMANKDSDFSKQMRNYSPSQEQEDEKPSSGASSGGKTQIVNISNQFAGGNSVLVVDSRGNQWELSGPVWTGMQRQARSLGRT